MNADVETSPGVAGGSVALPAVPAADKVPDGWGPESPAVPAVVMAGPARNLFVGFRLLLDT